MTQPEPPASYSCAKWRKFGVLILAQLLGTTTWFSISAVVPRLTAEWNLSGAQQSWLTMSLQIGFVVGVLISAMSNLTDRGATYRLVALSAADRQPQ